MGEEGSEAKEPPSAWRDFDDSWVETIKNRKRLLHGQGRLAMLCCEYRQSMSQFRSMIVQAMTQPMIRGSGSANRCSDGRTDDDLHKTDDKRWETSPVFASHLIYSVLLMRKVTSVVGRARVG